MAKEIVLVDPVYLQDFDGSDATIKNPDQVRQKVQRMAISSLPAVLTKAIDIIKHSKNEKNVIQAMKFIKTLSDGQVKGKTVQAYSKKLSNQELLKQLDGQYEEVD